MTLILTWLWVIATTLGALFSLKSFGAAKKDQLGIRWGTRNGALKIITTGDVRREGLILATLSLFSAAGWAAVLIQGPTAGTLVRLSVVVGAVLLAASSGYRNRDRRRLLELLSQEGDQP